jgi:hypothetical protein
MAQLWPHSQFVQKLLKRQNSESKHFRVHWPPQCFENATQSETQVRRMDKVMVDERTEKLTRQNQFMLWVFREKTTLIK